MNDRAFLLKISPVGGRSVGHTTAQTERLREEGKIVEEIGETSRTLHLTRKGLIERATS
jgi:hypothetical protein